MPLARNPLIMRQITLKTILCIFVFLFALRFERPVLAHGGEPRLEISADRLNPGDTLDIRGVDFEFEEEVTLDLVTGQVVVPFGTVLADAEGIFLLTITLPFDLVQGTYVLRATTDDHVVESPPINVWGSADLGGGEEGAWEEGDSLLAPMPTSMPATAVPVAQLESSENIPAQNSSFSPVWIFVTLGVILVIAILRVVKK